MLKFLSTPSIANTEENQFRQAKNRYEHLVWLSEKLSNMVLTPSEELYHETVKSELSALKDILKLT